MGNFLTPDYYVKSIYSIDFNKLKSIGIENLIIDIDNTLMPWGSKEADEKVRKLFKELKTMGFKICILSNRTKRKVEKFKGDLDVYYFSFGRKPMKIMFLGALRKLGGKSNNTCIIGDQIFTDVFGGNSCGLYTILVDPINDQEFTGTKWLRRLEANIRKKLKYEEGLMSGE
jgi:HAD superfamily phosphatase (TIGR01668 family)